MKIKIQILAVLLPMLLGAVSPVFQMPLDDSADVLNAKGGKIAAGIVHGQAGYQPGVSGRALDVKRHAYDQVTALVFDKLPAMDCNNGTVAFWFQPHWQENDPDPCCILFGNDIKWKGFMFYLLKTKTAIELSVCAPKQIQILKKDLFQANQWTHVAFTWNQEKSEVKLYLNGKEVAARTVPGAFQYVDTPVNLAVSCGRGTDRFKADVGNALYDDIKIFDQTLSAAEIFQLASDGEKLDVKQLSLDPAKRDGDGLSFALCNRDGRLSGPQKLLVLSTADGKNKLTFVAQGASGKLSLLVDAGGKTQNIESSYTLNLAEPHQIALRQNGNQLTFLLDGATQGEITLPTPLDKIEQAEGSESVSLLAPDTVPAREQAARLSDLTERPLEKSLWSLADAQRFEEGVRRGISLNGYWRVIPVNDYSYAPPAGPWGYMRVPGSFRSPLWQIYKDDNGILTSLNWQWDKQSLIKYRCGWYQRVFEVPAEWRQSGRVYLDFANLNGDNARVYLNGVLIDAFRQDFKTFTVVPNARCIDVTDKLTKSGGNVVTVFIDRHYVGLWMGQPSIGDHSEIALGNVWLENAPSQISLITALALPSYRQHQVTLRARIQNPAGKKGKITVRFDFRHGDDVTTFTDNVELDGQPEETVTFTRPWSNPVLWDVDHPNVYQMLVSLEQDGKDIDTLAARDFGFREAWVENGEFRMNGQKMRLRMWSSPGLDRLRYYYGNPQAVGQYVAHVKEMNYDTVRFDPFKKTSQVAWDDYLQQCDRQGLYNLFPMPPYEGEEINGYTAEVLRFLEYYGNHPSILMWYTDFNTCSYPWNQDPAKLNDVDYVPAGKVHTRQLTQIAEKVMRSLDPCRELFQHAGGNSGKIFTSMNYQSLGTPLQEQRDWPRQWSEKHSQPLMVVESAFPFPAQYWRFHEMTFFQPGEELVAEHAARYFGDAVFAREARPVPYADPWLNSPYADWNANMLALSAMLYKDVVTAWRAYDVSALGDFPGERDMVRTARTYAYHNVVYEHDDDVKSAGLKPDIPVGWSETQHHNLTDYSQPEGLDKVIREVFAPLLVFLGGDPEDFTNLDHAFYTGEKFRKSIIVVNDRSTRQTIDCRWELLMDGKTVAQGKIDAAADPGAILKLPIQLSAPLVYKRTDARLHLTVLRDGALLKEDDFALQFFPKRVAPEFRDVAAGLYDPEGKTEAMLKLAGFPYRKVQTLDEVKSCRLLIIGQNALTGANPEFLKQLETSGLIENGLKVLIFEQPATCNLANFVMESPSYRNAFIRRSDSPYVAGLKEEDFSNWRGSADTVSEFVISDENTPHYPRSKWKCGNGGIVSGNVIRKPSYGNFTAVVDCGFNLMFASLLELRKGHGLILFCQLDVTSRYLKDPAATLVADNLLREMNKRFVPVGPQRAVYLGDDKNEAILKRMGLDYRKLNPDNLWEITNAQVLLLGADPVPAEKRDALKKILAKGITTVMLPGSPLELLPDKLERGEKYLFRAAAPKQDVLFAGIPDADLYFREARKLPVLTSAPDWTVATQPALFAKLDAVITATVVMNLAPDAIDGFWNQEKIARVWSAIFNNMNLGLGKDLKIFTATKSRHNTLAPHFGEAVPENCTIRLDPENNGKVTDTEGFAPIKLGCSWESCGFLEPNKHYQYPANTPEKLKRPYDGYAWYRCTVKIPASWRGCTIRLEGGPIDDSDWTYWNGEPIGETTLEKNPNAYMAKRNYPIPEKLIKFGADNTLMIRVFDRWGEGGVMGPLKVIADLPAQDSWSPYIDALDFYDVDAFHNW